MRRSFILFFVILVTFFFSKNVFAASINYSPVSKNISVDETFTITVSLASSDKAVNAFSGSVTFPENLLSVKSVSTDGSVADFWTIQPSIGSSSIRFEGLVLNPGFTGSSGKLFSVTFESKSQGVAYVSLTSASTLANDGLGTNIFNGVIPKSTITIGAVSPVSTTPVVTEGVPLAPIVSSSTHPDPSSWYNNKKVTLEWEVPDSVTDVNYSIDKIPTSTPPSFSKGVVSSFTTEELSDGEYYFHIRFKNSSGWGNIAHFRVGIDTESPRDLLIEQLTGYDDGTLHVSLNAKDEVSGIEKYEITIGGEDPVEYIVGSGDHFISKVLSSGKKLFFVRALDFAGNSTANGLYLEVESVNPPVITDYPQNILSGENVKISGIASPSSYVEIYFERQNVGFLEKILLRGKLNRETNSVRVSADSSGKFSFSHSHSWHSGSYKIWAKTILKNGAESLNSSVVEVGVLPGEFAKFMESLKRVLLPIIPVLLVVIIIIALSIVLRKFFKKYRKIIIAEAEEASSVTTESLKILDEEVMDEIALLKKIRSGEPLSEHEQKFLSKLKGDIDTAGTIIQKEIKDIEEKV